MANHGINFRMLEDSVENVKDGKILQVRNVKVILGSFYYQNVEPFHIVSVCIVVSDRVDTVIIGTKLVTIGTMDGVDKVFDHGLKISGMKDLTYRVF